MKIVIDIPEDVYTRLFDNGIQDNEIATDDICEMARALRLGTPLPKGHGRLIDADELIQDIKDDSQLYYFNSNAEKINYELKVEYAIDRIADAPTIIKADKAESEE